MAPTTRAIGCTTRTCTPIPTSPTCTSTACTSPLSVTPSPHVSDPSPATLNASPPSWCAGKADNVSRRCGPGTTLEYIYDVPKVIAINPHLPIVQASAPGGAPRPTPNRPLPAGAHEGALLVPPALRRVFRPPDRFGHGDPPRPCCIPQPQPPPLPSLTRYSLPEVGALTLTLFPSRGGGTDPNPIPFPRWGH
jgi:hypothetical protein